MSAFARALEARLGRAPSSDERDRIERAVGEGRAAWPAFDVPIELLAKTFGDAFGSTENAPASLHAAELYLVAACVAGVAAARHAFAQHYLADVPKYVRKVDASPAFADDVRQRLATSLLVATGEGPIRLAQYKGRGPLRGFVRVAATRVALNAKRNKDERVESLSARDGVAEDDPERAVMKKRDASSFRRAFERAVADLDVDERNVLRLHYLDGLTLEDVAAAYKVGRATAARWIAKAKEHVVRGTMERLTSGPSTSKSMSPREWLDIVEA
ncbi:MAG TPA: sigma-70 family RNA polymerase sigma factor, partial [Polyangiaceae bacterium]